MPEQSGMRDYVRWHDAYDDPTSALSIRLRHVQRAISDWYDATPGPVTVMSSCAGQGHDILGVLESRPELRERTTGALVELHPTNVAIARERIARLGVDLRVVEGDAALTDTYVGTVPADLVLLVGIMGNITVEDNQRLVAATPQLCRPGARVIWTRGAQQPDLAPDIRRWFGEAGFRSVSYESDVEGTPMRVGVEELVGPPEPLREGERLFTFHR